MYKNIENEIYIRKLEFSDLATSHKFINSTEINEIMGYLPISMEEQRKWYETTINNKSKFIFAIYKRNNDEYIGNVGFGNIDYINRNAMLSIFIFKPQDRNKNYGKKSMKLILNFAFNRLNLHKITVRTATEYGIKTKTDTISFYKKCGFKIEGIQKEQYYRDGKYINRILMGIFKNDYIQ